jgi:hypothetical protein
MSSSWLIAIPGSGTRRVKAKGKRQEAKGKNELPCRHVNELSSAAMYPPLLPFAFCLLPFAFPSGYSQRRNVLRGSK